MRAHFDSIITIVCLALIFLFPLLVQDPYYRHVLTVACLYAIGVYGYNIITGINGQLNLAHAGFMGIGAYTSAQLMLVFSLNFWIALPVSVLITALCGLLIGIPTLRTRGVYFALTTIGFGEILFIIFDNWIPVTGGPMGLTGIPTPSPLTIIPGLTLTFTNKVAFFYMCLVFLVIAFYLNRVLLHSRLGRAMLAVKENEDLAKSVGISITGSKTWAFVLATALIGLSGCLYAYYFRVISPVSFTVPESFRCLTMLVVGGMGTLAGPLVGSLLFTIIPEILWAIDEYQLVVYGLVLMLCIAFLPEGIIGLFKTRLAERTAPSMPEEK